MLTPSRHLKRTTSEQGFTLVELMVASLVSMLVLAGAVMLTSQVQTGYRRQVEAAAAEQEARFALEWIGKLIRGADNDPFNVATSACPVAGTVYSGIIIDPNDDDVNDDIRLQTDSNPPDGLVGGAAGECIQALEDVTISFDDDNDAIVFFDNNLAPEATIRTDAVIENLEFVYRNSAHQDEDPPGTPITPANVRYVEVRITARSRTVDPSTGAPATRTLSSEIRVRSR